MEFTLSEALIYYQNGKLDEWIQKFLRAEFGDMPNPNFALADGLLLEDRKYFSPICIPLGEIKTVRIEKDILDNVERIISQFNSEDPQSMTFRYPVTRGPNRKDSLNRETIDLNNFKNVIDKLIYFFDWQWDMISQFEDMKAEMIADMYREYWH